MSVEKSEVKVTKIEKAPSQYYTPHNMQPAQKEQVFDKGETEDAPYITEWIKENAQKKTKEERKISLLFSAFKEKIAGFAIPAQWKEAVFALALQGKKAVASRARWCGRFAALHAKKLAVSGVASVVLIGVSAVVIFSTCSMGFHIKLGDKDIGTLPSEQLYYDILSDVKEEVLDTADMDFEPSGELQVNMTLVGKGQFTEPEEVKEKLKATSSEMVPAWTVKVDDKQVVALSVQQDALGVLDEYKRQYAEEGATLSFQSKVEVEKEYVPIKLLKSKEEAFAYLNSEEAPLIAVQTVVEIEGEEPVAYETQQQEDNTKYIGDVTVLQQGVEGLKYVKYMAVKVNGVEKEKTVLKEEILCQPIEQVEQVGTKEPPSPIGTGEFAQPVSGTLTSAFGERWNREHCGIDIGASTGTMIYAADNGTVVYSQFNNGGYGNLVQIDHGNGYTTYYGHCSELLVKEGDVVAKGDPIAKVGSTGRSTGPHLHFEVRKNNEPQNPLEYLN